MILDGLLFPVIFLMILLIAITYMFSQALKVPEWEVFAKVELYELFISVLILISAEAFFQFSADFSNTLVGGDPFDAARDFITKSVVQGVYPALDYSYSIIGWYSTINTFMIRPSDAVWTWTYKVAPGADLLVSMANLCAFGFITIYGSLTAQLFLLSVIQATMHSLVFPIGLLLRFFPPTRQAGAFAITLAIAFYAVYPTTFAIHSIVMDEMAKLEECGHVEGCDAEYEPFSEAEAFEQRAKMIASPYLVGLLTILPSPLCATIAGKPIIGKLCSLAGFLSSETFVMTAQPKLFSPLIESFARLSLVTFFLPALSMVITIAFINGVSKFLISKV